MPRRPVQLLASELARKIAAGEVVDRPAAVVRELLDNAIDAEAQNIVVSLEDGGTRLIEVSDDGTGMSEADLRLCWLPHATSKIVTEDDLLQVESLGFRGEALASMAAVARLEILTVAVDQALAVKLIVGPGGFDRPPAISYEARRQGTTVRVIALFDNFPARKQFLKRAAAEARLGQQAFIDKALAFPEIAFKLMINGQLKTQLPAVASRLQRFAAVHPLREAVFLHEIPAEGTGFSLSVVLGGPEWQRNDRRYQYVFVNGRRLQNFALLQALEYSVQGWFPNTSHPVGAVYIDISPELVDFNIHPAKREARFKDEASLHRAIVAAVSAYVKRRSYQRSFYGEDSQSASSSPLAVSGLGLPSGGEPTFSPQARQLDLAVTDQTTAYAASSNRQTNQAKQLESKLAIEALLNGQYQFAPLPGRAGDPTADDFNYIGVVFNLFLVVETGGTLYLIDQHAAHERLLFDQLQAAPLVKQELLVPLHFSCDSPAEDQFLDSRRLDLSALGIELEREGEVWLINALPAAWGRGDTTAIKALLDLQFSHDLNRDWLMTLACRAATKQGDILDDSAAEAIARAALKLAIPRCPHGRPLWFEISREALFKAVQRT